MEKSSGSPSGSRARSEYSYVTDAAPARFNTVGGVLTITGAWFVGGGSTTRTVNDWVAVPPWPSVTWSVSWCVPRAAGVHDKVTR